MTGKQPIETSLLGHAQSHNSQHFLKDILHILNILYITSVPDVERGNVQLR